jgi:hypothetical protein
MPSLPHEVEPIEVVVTLLPPLEQFAAGTDGVAFRVQLQEQLGEVIADLGIPAGIALTVTSASNVGATNGPPYKISINTRPARMPLVQRDDIAASAAILSRRIGDAVRERRQMLLSAAICEHIRRKWALESGLTPDSLPSDVVGQWLSRLVACGLRIDRTMPIAALHAAAAGGLVALRQLEDVIASSPTIGLRVRVGAGLFDSLRQSGPAASGVDGDELDAGLRGLSGELFTELGLVVDPPVVIRDHGLADRQFRLQLNELRWAPHDAPMHDVRLPSDSATVLAIVGAARSLVGMHAPYLMTTAAVCHVLDLLHEREPALVETVLSRFDPTVITWILRDLLEDFVSVRDLRNILEAFASIEGLRSSATAMGDSVTTADVEYWSNWIRSELTRQITHPLMAGSSLVVHLVAPDLEARVVASDINPLSDAERQELVQLVLTAWQAQASGPMIILTSLEVKRRLRRLIADELPEVRVIAYQELDPMANITPRARIGADAQAATRDS